LIERSFQGLSVAIETMRIVKELVEIWPNEVCDRSFLLLRAVRLANSKARIKPTAPLSVFDKENSIEFPLDFLHYLYNYYMVYALFSHAYHVTHHVI